MDFANASGSLYDITLSRIGVENRLKRAVIFVGSKKRRYLSRKMRFLSKIVERHPVNASLLIIRFLGGFVCCDSVIDVLDFGILVNSYGTSGDP